MNPKKQKFVKYDKTNLVERSENPKYKPEKMEPAESRRKEGVIFVQNAAWGQPGVERYPALWEKIDPLTGKWVDWHAVPDPSRGFIWSTPFKRYKSS